MKYHKKYNSITTWRYALGNINKLLCDNIRNIFFPNRLSVINAKYLSFLLLLPSIIFGVNKVHECKITDVGIYQSSRICKSEFIAQNPNYSSGDIESIVSKPTNSIELYANKKRTFRGYIGMSFAEDKYRNIAIGYKNFVAQYAQSDKENILVQNISIGYELSYEIYNFYIYTTPHIGASRYSIDLSRDGFLLAIKTGIRREVFNTQLSLFANVQKEFIGDLRLNIMSFGASVGF